MKVTARLNGVKTVKNIPTHWAEVTFRQFVDLYEIGADEVGILAYFLDIDKATLRKAEIKNPEVVLDSLAFMNKDLVKNVPPTILGFDVPKDLRFETIGQYEDVKAEVAKLKEPTVVQLMSLYPLFVGTYTMKPYDPLKVDEFSEQFWLAPCGEVMAIGDFTLMKLRGLKKTTRIMRLLAAIQKTRLVQAIQNWRRNLAFTVLYSSWKYRHNIKDQS